ncbi:MAG: hypothetical protein AB1424_14165 [Thermodesulfobacteriota bacterium]
MMPPNSPQPELGPTCAHPYCCGREGSGEEAAAGNPAGVLQERPETRVAGVWASLKHSALWFLAFFGIYASSSVCLFCGTPGCPVGAGGAALVGGVFACLWQYGKSAWEKLRVFIAKSPR